MKSTLAGMASLHDPRINPRAVAKLMTLLSYVSWKLKVLEQWQNVGATYVFFCPDVRTPAMLRQIMKPAKPFVLLGLCVAMEIWKALSTF